MKTDHESVRVELELNRFTAVLMMQVFPLVQVALAIGALVAPRSAVTRTLAIFSLGSIVFALGRQIIKWLRS